MHIHIWYDYQNKRNFPIQKIKFYNSIDFIQETVRSLILLLVTVLIVLSNIVFLITLHSSTFSRYTGITAPSPGIQGYTAHSPGIQRSIQHLLQVYRDIYTTFSKYTDINSTFSKYIQMKIQHPLQVYRDIQHLLQVNRNIYSTFSRYTEIYSTFFRLTEIYTAPSSG